MGSLEFFVGLILPVALWPWVESVSNRNEFQEYFLGGKVGRCLGLITLPPLCANCLEIWEPQSPGNLSACPGLYRDCLTYICISYMYLPVQVAGFEKLIVSHCTVRATLKAKITCLARVLFEFQTRYLCNSSIPWPRRKGSVGCIWRHTGQWRPCKCTGRLYMAIWQSSTLAVSVACAKWEGH